MKNTKKNAEPTYKELREQLLAGEDPAAAGREDGTRNLPKPGAQQLSEFEAKMIERGQTRAAEAGEACQREVAANLEAFRSRSAPDPVHDIDEAEHAHEAELARKAAEWKERLGQLADRLRMARRQTKAVVDATGVQPPAGGWPKPIDFLIVVICAALIEGYVAWLLLEDALGDWQSVVMASAFTLANVMLGAGGGMGALRGRRGGRGHALESLRRLLTPLTLLGLLLFHFFLAHYRAIGLEGGDIADLMRRVTGAPLAPFVHYESWLLGIIAAFVYGVSAWKMFEFMGGAVELRKVDKARLAAEQDWEDGKLDYQEALAAAGDDASTDIQAAVAGADEWANAASTFADEILARVFSTNRFITAVKDAIVAISTTYRAANGNCRDEPEPAGWASPLPVDLREVSNPGAARAIAEKFAAITQQAKGRAEHAENEIRAREKRAMDGLDAFFAAAARESRNQVEIFSPMDKEDA